MTKEKFTDRVILEGLTKISNSAIKKCAVKFHSHLPKRLGLERLFRDTFIKSVDIYPEWQAETEVPRGSFSDTDKFRPKGWVDCIITHKDGYRSVIEVKICQLPRMNWNSPNESTYDVGQ